MNNFLMSTGKEVTPPAKVTVHRVSVQQDPSPSGLRNFPSLEKFSFTWKALGVSAMKVRDSLPLQMGMHSWEHELIMLTEMGLED